MIASVKTSSLVGYSSETVSVEADLSNSLPSIIIVGLGAKSVDEAKERIRSAIKNSNLANPKKRITINLSPADIPKNGTHFDLAIALSILLVSEQIPENCLDSTVVIGELGLDGAIKPTRGLISHLIGARKTGIKTAIIPRANHHEARLVDGIHLIPAKDLSQVYAHLTGSPIKVSEPSEPTANRAYGNDLKEVAGHESAKRGLEVAAAGKHNILLSGPPGGGKTLIANCLPGIMPPLSKNQILESTNLHSLSSNRQRVVRLPPIRSPHHTASTIALTGGGTNPLPGEVSLAHNGVLFLDEVAEFSRSSLEALRQPLESGSIHISRASGNVEYPANFMFVAAKNPCPCGNFGSDQAACECSQMHIDAYQNRLSGPLLDRIDIKLHIARTKHEKLLSDNDGAESSHTVRKRVVNAFNLQLNRQAKPNSELTKPELKAIAKISPPTISFLNEVAEKLNLSSRSYIRSLRVARTVADLRHNQTVEKEDIAQALEFRL